MKFAIIKDGLIETVHLKKEKDRVEVPNDAVCGMLWDGKELTIPTIVQTKEYIDTQWLRDRIEAYSELNQYEMQYNDVINGTTTWIEAIRDIKAKYIKPKG